MAPARLGRRGLLVSAASLALARSASAARVAGAPYFRGAAGFTGEAALAMILAEHAPLVDPAAVFAATGVDPAAGRGADAAGLARAAVTLGGAAHVWDAAVVGDRDGKALWAALRALIEGSGPCALELADGTFAAALAMSGGRLILHHPLRGPDLRLRRGDLAHQWPREVDGGRQVRAIQVGGLEHLRAPAGDERRLPALDLALAARDLRAQVEGRGWEVAVASPFVVTGDLPRERLDEHVSKVMSMALHHLRRDFFARDPEAPITAWLFADDPSYRRHARELFGEEPKTPFGYYDGARRALIMNVGTGGGTLVHEMVHPLLRANFRQAPPWVDEGMASLFEQCMVVGGRLVGTPNWRLPELQLRLRAGTCPDFAALLAYDAATFYNEDRGVHYAAARYLLYYLQEQGLLQRTWRALVAARGADDGGLAIVGDAAAALGHRDLRAFRRAWESFVLGLRYP